MDGLAPAIAIKQKNQTRNPRSTVATATEIYDYLRLLYARCGTVTCLHCGGIVKHDTVDRSSPPSSPSRGTRTYALFPITAPNQTRPMQARTDRKAGPKPKVHRKNRKVRTRPHFTSPTP
jgi:excinuclease ABC subunit A